MLYVQKLNAAYEDSSPNHRVRGATGILVAIRTTGMVYNVTIGSINYSIDMALYFCVTSLLFCRRVPGGHYKPR